MKFIASTVLLVPGLGNSGEDHWQSYWEKHYHFKRVVQEDWNNPDCYKWVETLDKAINNLNFHEIILVGHSLACATIAKWAELYNRKIKGALLVAPADTEAPALANITTGYTPMPLKKLPFAATVVASTNDEYVTISRAEYFTKCWGADFVNIGQAGHINASSGYNDWKEGLQLLQKFEIDL